MMLKANTTKLHLLLIIGLPLLVAAITMSWATSQMLDRIASKVNEQERVRSSQAARSAINSVEAGLKGVMIDNARWDDAAERTRNDLDTQWVNETWVVATTERNYDTFFIVGKDGKTLAAGQAGMFSDLKAADYLGQTLELALHTLQSKSGTFDAVSSVAKTVDGVSVFAMAPLQYFNNAKAQLHHPQKYLIFMRALSAPAVQELGNIHILENLALGPLSENKDGTLLKDQWGRPVATLTWSQADPGKAARESSIYAGLLSIAALLAVMLPLSVVHYQTMVKMKEEEFSAQRLSRVDSLTGLNNRTMLIEELGKKIPASINPNGLLVLAFIDLDGFKAVNDAFGHGIGDTLIRAVASGLRELAGENAILVRLGGDEFALLMTGPTAERDIERFATRSIKFMDLPFDIEGRLVSIGASVGITKCTSHRIEISEFMRQADLAMYQAKESGGNRWKWFNASLDMVRIEQLAIAAELKIILAEDTLEVAYQPFVNSRDRSIVGVEALARWPASSHRKISPDQFIHVAEEHGLIDKLGNAVLRKACTDMAAHKSLIVAVNVSALQLRNLNFVETLKTVLQSTGFDPERLEIEFTESVLIENPVRAHAAMQDVQNMGISLALDDFGMGFASVGYLREYAFNKIKLDRSLTNSISTNGLTQNIVQGTVLIAKGLAAQVIAEGVETEEQATLMRLAGCEMLQGYLFGKPQSALAIGELLGAKAAAQVA